MIGRSHRRLPVAPLVIGGAMSCGGGGSASPPLAAGPVEACGAALQVYAYDPDGDGIDELVRVEGEARGPFTLRWSGGSAPLPAHPQRGLAVDLDGDGRQSLLLAVGTGPGAAGAPLQLLELGADGLVERWRSDSPRGQATELRAVDGGVFLAHFVDDRVVLGGTWSPAGLQPAARAHMGMRQAPLRGGGVAVGRLYGDEPRSDGDLRVVAADGAARALPSLRGVRALAAVDLDEDGVEELIVGDGWHAEYGQRAVPRVRLLPGAQAEGARTIAHLDGSYAALELLPVGSGRSACLLAQGSHGAHLLCRDGLGWADSPLGPLKETGNIALLRAAEGHAVAMADGECRLRPLRSARSSG